MDSLIQKFTSQPSKMSVADIAQLYEAASDAYYNTGETILTDKQFDDLKDLLQLKDPKHPLLQGVGAPVQGTKVKLPYWMGSLDKIRDDDKTLQKWSAKHSGNVVISDKLDGNSALFVYNGKEAKLYSRGDGKEGQDISHLLPHLRNLPKPKESPIAIRGELIISKENWKTISDLGANARNVVAGAMHRKDPVKRITDVIDFIAYEVLHEHLPPSEQMALMKKLGFQPAYFLQKSTYYLTTAQLVELLMKRRKESPYEVDGIVIAHDALHNHVSGKNPSYAFAFKSMATHEEAEATVLDVEWNVSKHGYFKPTILIDPISLSGVTIQRVTGNNAAFIETHKIGPGSRLMIIRSGDVIPKVERVLSTSSNGKPSFPTVPYVWNDTHVDITLPLPTSKETDENEQQAIKKMVAFAKELKIDYLGEGNITKLYAAGITTIPKLLKATVAEIQKGDGLAGTMAPKIHQSIQKAKAAASCIDYMVASQLFGRGTGRKKIELIAQQLPKILDVQPVKDAELQAISGIGPATAAAFLEGYPKFIAFAKQIGYECSTAAAAASRPKSSEKPKPKVDTIAVEFFQGKTIVFTGFRDDEMEAAIKAAGGKVTTSVSGKTSLVVAANPNEESGKLQKARELGIQIMSKEAVRRHLGLV